MDMAEFVETYAKDAPVVEVPAGAERWPMVIVKHGKFAAVVQFMGLGDHLCIDVHPFVDGKGARVSAFGMEEGRRIEAFDASEAGGASFGRPAARMLSALIGEQS